LALASLSGLTYLSHTEGISGSSLMNVPHGPVWKPKSDYLDRDCFDSLKVMACDCNCRF